ncbi:2-keto-4-pentenoate hydratase [Kribbella sp. NPDC004875]|uniref:2-keto-4-pentenoate hydratase n=1 Tax=Kribbella sp. NPDC004875 TaxID=3364107 RepID=UPI0036C6DBC6
MPLDGLRHPRIAPSLAFVLTRPVAGRTLNVAEVLAAVGFVVPALALTDSRAADPARDDLLADNAAAVGAVLGSRRTPIESIDPRLEGCTLHHRGLLVGTGVAAAVGSPLTALAWLVNERLGRGEELPAGQVLLVGPIVPPVPVRAGDTVTAAFTHLGRVTAAFLEAPKGDR